jgi:hypothetical protein
LTPVPSAAKVLITVKYLLEHIRVRPSTSRPGFPILPDPAGP